MKVDLDSPKDRSGASSTEIQHSPPAETENEAVGTAPRGTGKNTTTGRLVLILGGLWVSVVGQSHPHRRAKWDLDWNAHCGYGYVPTMTPEIGHIH